MYLKFKRIIDVICAFLGLIILSPLLILIVIAIKIDSKGPILFKQKRVGMHKRHFNILKFRTMHIDSPGDTPTHLLENPEQWITRVGKILRKTSLDELPQILNILKGDMSVVGPRPALWNQYDLIEQRDMYKANDVHPGITGWAQINGRDSISIEKKAELDGYYVEKIGCMMDIRCFVGTIVSVIKRDGIVEGGTGNRSGNGNGSENGK
jgi:O-antigen biosynthesis protein WbqP